MAISGSLFWVLSYVFPPPGLHEESEFTTHAVPMDESSPEQETVTIQQTKEKDWATSDFSV